MQQATRLFLFTLGIYFLMVTAAVAGSTGTDIPELIDPAISFFEALRNTDFTRIVAIVIFGLTLLGMIAGYITAGLMPVMIMLFALGGFVGAEAIAHILFTSGAVI